MTSQAKKGIADPEDEGLVLGSKLREAGEYVGFKQDQVVRHLGIPRIAVSEMEKGTRTVGEVSPLPLRRATPGFFRSDGVVQAESRGRTLRLGAKEVGNSVF